MAPTQAEILHEILTNTAGQVNDIRVMVADIQSTQKSQQRQIVEVLQRLSKVETDHTITRSRQDEFRRNRQPGSITDVSMLKWTRNTYLLVLVSTLISLGTALSMLWNGQTTRSERNRPVHVDSTVKQ